MRLLGVCILFVFIFAFCATAFGATDIVSIKAQESPALDGDPGDAVWKDAPEKLISDSVTGELISIKSVYRNGVIFFLVAYNDSEENALHKPMVLDEKLGVYKIGPKREDAFVFKWSLSGNDVDLSNFSDDEYKADVWYWKANRTNPAGFADDKFHVLSSKQYRNSKEVKSLSGRTRYLLRQADTGKGASVKRDASSFKKSVEDQYAPGKPEGSRADVRAKGVWKDGRWTIELARKLDTGHRDDIKLDPNTGKSYLFGISSLGLYGNPIDKSKDTLYGMGRISQPLKLVFR